MDSSQSKLLVFSKEADFWKIARIKEIFRARKDNNIYFLLFNTTHGYFRDRKIIISNGEEYHD